MSCRNPDFQNGSGTGGAGAYSFFDSIEQSPAFQAFDTKPVMVFIAVVTLIITVLSYVRGAK